MTEQQLQELKDVGGGATGASKVAEPAPKKATLPNSKDQGEKTAMKSATAVGHDEIQDTDPENNTKATADTSAQNKASVSMKEDMDALFSGEDALSEDFKLKAATIYEAAVNAQVETRVAELEEQFALQLEEQVETIVEELSSKIDDYMNYVVNEWMTENEVAIESSLRSEITEEFIDGLRNLFNEHYIDIPEDKVEVVEELAARVEELENRLNESLEENIELSKTISEQAKLAILDEVSEGLVPTQADKFMSLAEGVEFSDAATYKKKLELVKENYFGVKSVKPTMLEEEVSIGDTPEAETKKVTGPVASYVHAISRTVKK